MTGAHHWISAGLALALGGVAFRAFQRIRGTTLAAPAAWAVAAALAIASVETYLAAFGDAVSPLAASILRYAAAAGTFCPLMAVLGAKRPQDRGWQWIVLSLWIALVVPAGQAWLAQPGSTFILPPMWRLLVFALLALLPLNYGPTSCGGAALLATLAQTSLLAQWMMSDPNPEASAGMAVLLLFLAIAWPPRREPALTPLNLLTPAGPFTRRWLAFRDGWGAFWGLRVMHRINETAEAGQWPVRLTWGGFAFTDEHRDAATLDERVAVHIDQTMDSLLWRFERRNQQN